MDDSTVKIGLLLEAAETQQGSAAAALDRLHSHAAGLDAVVREEIRATLVEELQGLQAHTEQAAGRLRALGLSASWRAVSVAVAIVLVATLAPLAVAWWLLPGAAEIATLRATRDQLAAQVQRLRQDGGAIDLKHCGAAQRLCVRVERTAPRYGEAADYLVLKGY